MALTIGTYTLSDGTRSQPYRVTSSSGARSVQPATPIRAPAKVFDRAGRRFEEIVEVSYSYDTPALARAAWIAMRAAVLALDKGAYVDNGTTVGNALVADCQTVYAEGCGLTVSFHIQGELA